MRIVIVGGGMAASNVVGLLLQDPTRNWSLTMIEKEAQTCRLLANRYDQVTILCGDGSRRDVLEAARTGEADIFLAMTGRDEDNLVACQLAQTYFGIERPICRVNNPDNLEAVHRLGIHTTFSSSLLLAKVLMQEIDFPGLTVVYDIPGNSKCIIEFLLDPASEVTGKPLEQCQFPAESRVVLVTHPDGRVEEAHGRTVMEGRARVMMLCDRRDFQAIGRNLALLYSEEGEED